MKHKAIRGISFFVSLPECSDYQFRICIGRDMPGNDFSGVEIHHNAQIVPFAGDFQISDVADPYGIGSFLVKVLQQMAGTGPVIRTSGRDRWFIRGHFWKL